MEDKEMAKKVCVVCGKEMGMMTRKLEISDGYECAPCLLNARIHTFSNRMLIIRPPSMSG